jgi:hypothetical protein
MPVVIVSLQIKLPAMDHLGNVVTGGNVTQGANFVIPLN